MPGRHVEAGDRRRVVVGREIARLAGANIGGPAEDAVVVGQAVRRKVEGIWLYAAAEEHIDAAQQKVLGKALELCREWFLSPMRPLAGKTAKDLGGLLTMEATRPLLRGHVRAGRLAAVPALTAEFEPHLLLHDPGDLPEVRTAVDAALGILAVSGSVTAEDLPGPSTPRSSKAWRYNVLAHLEWAGVGEVYDGALTRWSDL